MSWNSISLLFRNETVFDFSPLSGITPVLLSGTTLAPSPAKLSRNTPLTPLAVLSAPDATTKAGALFSYDFPDTLKALVIWVYLDPAKQIAEFQLAVVDKAIPIDTALLLKLNEGSTDHDDLQFFFEKVISFKDTNVVNHEIAIETVLAYEFVEIKAEQDGVTPSAKNPTLILSILDSFALEEKNKEPQDDSLYKIAAGPAHRIGQPLHENIAIAALINAASLDSKATYDSILGSGKWKVNNPSAWEIIRGLIWNDDPACLLFLDFSQNNGIFSSGTLWYGIFSGKLPSKSDPIIRRSHYLDLQFLHAMGAFPGEKPIDTKKNIMMWLEIMYKLATNTGVVPTDTLSSKLPTTWFNANTKPKGSQTFKDLFLARTPSFTGADIPRRALGSCLHLIQDSYAVGHCDRVLLNAADKQILSGQVKFADGARFGGITNFHCYEGQDHKKHEGFDVAPDMSKLNPSDPTTFKAVVGATDAIEKCAKFVSFWKSKTPWDNGVKTYVDGTIFLLSNATISNINVA